MSRAETSPFTIAGRTVSSIGYLLGRPISSAATVRVTDRTNKSHEKINSKMSDQHYDIVGDIHGHAGALRRLLKKLGYDDDTGVFRHAKSKMIFVGDFIDRGPEQR